MDLGGRFDAQSQGVSQNISRHPLELERWFFQLPEQDLH